jgi:hypothetical protein
MSISQLGLDSQNHFNLLLDTLRAIDDDDFEVGLSNPRSVLSNTVAAVAEELGRFRTWANNIGALSSGRGSLDYRFRDAEYLRHNVKTLLEDLKASLQDGTTITPK